MRIKRFSQFYKMLKKVLLKDFARNLSAPAEPQNLSAVTETQRNGEITEILNTTVVDLMSDMESHRNC